MKNLSIDKNPFDSFFVGDLVIVYKEVFVFTGFYAIEDTLEFQLNFISIRIT